MIVCQPRLIYHKRMQRYLCYLLLLLIALPAWSVHVPMTTTANALNVVKKAADNALITENSAARHAHHPAAEPEHSCHSVSTTESVTNNPGDTEHDCCHGDQQHQCDNNCTTQHCSASAALLMVLTNSNNAFLRDELNDHQSLPEWLFFKDPPPPINA